MDIPNEGKELTAAKYNKKKKELKKPTAGAAPIDINKLAKAIVDEKYAREKVVDEQKEIRNAMTFVKKKGLFSFLTDMLQADEFCECDEYELYEKTMPELIKKIEDFNDEVYMPFVKEFVNEKFNPFMKSIRDEFDEALVNYEIPKFKKRTELQLFAELLWKSVNDML